MTRYVVGVLHVADSWFVSDLTLVTWRCKLVVCVDSGGGVCGSAQRYQQRVCGGASGTWWCVVAPMTKDRVS